MDDLISIHALLAESDARRESRQQPAGISIHALLAESDSIEPFFRKIDANFYPRSPCGERQTVVNNIVFVSGFLSTLSLRRATQAQRLKIPAHGISIHALLAESDRSNQSIIRQTNNFYPRSPCGERRLEFCDTAPHIYFYPRSPCGERPRTQSTSLSA